VKDSEAGDGEEGGYPDNTTLDKSEKTGQSRRFCNEKRLREKVTRGTATPKAEKEVKEGGPRTLKKKGGDSTTRKRGNLGI